MKPVEVVIACHNPRRRIGRAVASVLDGNQDSASVAVICHNVTVESVAARLRPADVDKVRFVELHDGIASPAGPFTVGLESSPASWVSVMGSDDYLQPGAVRRWLEVSEDADAVVAPLRLDTGGIVRTPPARPFQRGLADVLKDRLFYRSAPLGLVRQTFVTDQKISFAPGLATGEDLPFTSRLWTEGRVRVVSGKGAYIVGTDGDDRVSGRLRSAEDEFQHMPHVWNTAWLRKWPSSWRDALGTKYFRVHIFGFAFTRARRTVETGIGAWQPSDLEVLHAAGSTILELAPKALKPLSVADRSLWRAIESNDDPMRVEQLALARRRFGTPPTLLTGNAKASFSREGPLRFMAASALVH